MPEGIGTIMARVMKGMVVRMRVPMMIKAVVVIMVMMVMVMMTISMLRMTRMTNLVTMPEEKGVQHIQTGGTAVHGWRGGRDRRFRSSKLF